MKKGDQVSLFRADKHNEFLCCNIEVLMKTGIIIILISLSLKLQAEEDRSYLSLVRAPATQPWLHELKGEQATDQTKVSVEELNKMKMAHDKAYDSGNVKEANELALKYYLYGRKLFEQQNRENIKAWQEDSKNYAKQIVALKKEVAKCENERTPATINNSKRGFVDTVKDIFSFERKDGPAPVEDRTFSK